MDAADQEVDDYVILGLPSGAKLSEEEINEAYLSKIGELYPDERPDDPNAHRDFLNICASYKIFRDEREKARQSLMDEKEKARQSFREQRASMLRNRFRDSLISRTTRAV